MEIEKIQIEQLTEDPGNVRKHPEKNIEAIKGSLKRFGQQKPVVIDKDNIVVAGNGTLQAAKSLGWQTIACVRTDLAGVEKTGFAIADNRTAELALWDDDALGKTLQSLCEDNFDLGDIGFDIEDLPEALSAFDNDLDDSEKDKDKKYTLEIELPDEQAQKDCYEDLCSQGFIVRVK